MVDGKMERKKYPIRAEDYELFEVVGQGVSAQVYRARCIPLDDTVAIKILDFERNNSDLSNISREAQTMILIDHPNVLRAHCSFVNGHNLWVVMPYMAGGSCLHIMKSVYPHGFEETVIATILKDVLKGLEYLHHHGHIHRDVKAGNILVDTRGAIKLGDFGVSACLFDSGDRQRTRNTFVGTPCWMAPEVMEQLHGYDFKLVYFTLVLADIWSFGITALELAHGHAPFSKYPPMKVLLMTLQNAPPSLDYERDKKFSRSFKHMIATCLVKDPSKRPSAQKLLKQPFFRQAKSHDYLVRKILEGLPTLGDRHQALKAKEEDLLAQKKMPYGKKEEISQNEYKRGISGWNFDTEDLKYQASLISENDENKESNGCQIFEIDTLQERNPESMSSCSSFTLKDDDQFEDAFSSKLNPSLPDKNPCNQRIKVEVLDNELKLADISDQNVVHFGFVLNQNETTFDANRNCATEVDQNQKENTLCESHEPKASTSSSSLEVLPSSKPESLAQKPQNELQNMENCNGGLAPSLIDSIKSTCTDEIDDKSKSPLVQQKGRFKVTSESVDLDKTSAPCLQKSQSMLVFTHLSSPTMQSTIDSAPTLGCSMLSQLHQMLQTNMVQKDNILSMMRQLSTGDSSPISNVLSGRATDVSSSGQTTMNEKSLLEVAHEREKELLQEISELHWKLASMQDELQRLKMRND
ncbi:hypothetical protein ZIOFF_043754 [Zingiber officinale]|uniref:Protein kinase domain-containing protein n=1 Tax=Zingiber officinale TaxID=94328 RepID=A0A8J5FX69_ZINOF|nr:hypothetical protein ZIOFF_043754 [Zingiber officinale]